MTINLQTGDANLRRLKVTSKGFADEPIPLRVPSLYHLRYDRLTELLESNFGECTCGVQGLNIMDVVEIQGHILRSNQKQSNRAQL